MNRRTCKKERPSKENPHPRNLIQHSKNFLEAALNCLTYPLSRAGENLPSTTAPSIVCAAFALELALKALLYLKGDKPHGHDLWGMFDKLPADLKKALITNAVKPEDLLIEKLKRDTDAFQEWRYAPEYAVNRRIFADYDNLVELAQSAIAVFESIDKPDAPA